MKWSQKSGFVCGLLVATVLGIAIGMSVNTPANAQVRRVVAIEPHYAVLESEGTNLIVTDNQKNTVYFYTVDQGEKPGADLHLRGTIDLTQVGNATIKPTLISPKKE